jgi:prefoldin subunit 5
MGHTNNPPKTLSEVIDELERIQGELLSLQRSLEKLESVEALVSSVASED